MFANCSNCSLPSRCLCGECPRIYAFPCPWGNEERSGVLRGKGRFREIVTLQQNQSRLAMTHLLLLTIFYFFFSINDYSHILLVIVARRRTNHILVKVRSCLTKHSHSLQKILTLWDKCTCCCVVMVNDDSDITTISAQTIYA